MRNALLLFIFILFALPEQIDAQIIRKKVEKNYRHLSTSDSILTVDKVYEFNKEAAIISKSEKYYSQQGIGNLIKEVNARFDSSKMILDEHIYNYKSTGTDHERLKTKYTIYKANENDSKYIWRQYFDVSEEIVREDTLTYDNAGNLISRMVFDYRGNTSQGADVYTYDKKNRLKRWKWYSYWSTVNKKSKPVTNKEKKQDYKYKYNKSGKIIKVSGKRYSTVMLETYKYDSNGNLIEFLQTKTKKSKNSKSERKKKGKYNISIDKIQKTYNNGYLTLEKQLSNDKETNKIEICYYKDSLVSNRTNYIKGEKTNEIRFEYDKNNKPSKKFTQNYLNNKAHSLIISDYDNKGNIILEVRTLNGNEMNRTELEYDEKSNLKSVRSYMKTKNAMQLFESENLNMNIGLKS